MRHTQHRAGPRSSIHKGRRVGAGAVYYSKRLNPARLPGLLGWTPTPCVGVIDEPLTPQGALAFRYQLCPMRFRRRDSLGVSGRGVSNPPPLPWQQGRVVSARCTPHVASHASSDRPGANSARHGGSAPARVHVIEAARQANASAASSSCESRTRLRRSAS